MGIRDSLKKSRRARGAFCRGLFGCPEFIADNEFRSAYIRLNGSIAYVSSSFLSATAPAAKSAETKQAEAAGKVQCEYCGEWFEAGNDYRNHVMAAHTGTGQDEELVQCEYCGEWFRAGNDYRNHVMAAHTSSGQDEDLVQCEYCGEWFEAGNDYRNHVMAAHSGQ